MLTTRGGVSICTIGQDVSIRISQPHRPGSARLYLQETFTFIFLTAEAAVALVAPREAKKS